MEIKEVTVGELNKLFQSGKYNIEIDTPDGFQSVTKWFNKGKLPMVSVVTETGESTRCAVNHLLQDDEGKWVPAGILSVGDLVKTKNKNANSVVAIEELNDEECYDFTVDHENHRYWGDDFSSHNSGKSYICSGNIIKNAQEQGIFVILIDTENALDESWLHALGVDTSEEKLLKLSLCMIDDVAKTISEFMKEYKMMEEAIRPKILFVVDSLGMLLTPTDVNQFEAGDMKGDMGRKPKALTALVRNCVNMFGSYNVGLVATNHTYASQDPYNPDPNISGGCLTAGHLVWMEDGSAKPIEEITSGDTVVTLDGPAQVSKTFKFDDKEVFEIELASGEIIRATGEHKFLTRNFAGNLEWKQVDDLNANDAILQVV